MKTRYRSYCWQECGEKMCLVIQSYPTLWDPMDFSLPGFSVHGIFQGRILEWLAIFFSRGSSRLRDQTQISCISCTGDVDSLPLRHLGKSTFIFNFGANANGFFFDVPAHIVWNTNHTCSENYVLWLSEQQHFFIGLRIFLHWLILMYVFRPWILFPPWPAYMPPLLHKTSHMTCQHGFQHPFTFRFRRLRWDSY